MGFKDITKEQFLAAYNKHLPNGWTSFVYKYFSQSTKPEDMHVKKIFQGSLIGLFLFSLIATMANASRLVIGIPTVIFTILLFSFGILAFGAFIMNNGRIKKIRKELGGITAEEYNALVEKFMD